MARKEYRLSALVSVLQAPIGYAWTVTIVDLNSGSLHHMITGTSWTYGGAIRKIERLRDADTAVRKGLAQKVARELEDAVTEAGKENQS